MRSGLLLSQWVDIITVDRPMNLAKACIGLTKTQTHTSKQTNEPIQKPSSPQPHPILHLGCSAFMSLFFSPSFFVSPSTPIWCVWTRPLAANSLPWTPSAVWLSTVSWAWLLVSGRDRPVLSPVQHAAFCRPASSFTEGSTHRQRGRDEKVVCQALALRLFDFQSLMTNSCLGAPRQKHFQSKPASFLPLEKRKVSPHGAFWHFIQNIILKQDLFPLSPQLQI